MYQILVIDDKEIFRRKIKRLDYFKESSDFCIVAEASNGQEALACIQENSIDIAITDIRMPIMDGIEFLKEAKQRKLCECVILLSEYTDFAYAKEGLVNGAFDYVVKPIDNEKIMSVMERAKTYLEEQKIHFASEIKNLVSLIMHGDRYALEIAKNVGNEIVTVNRDKMYNMLADYQSFMEQLMQVLEENMPSLILYINKDNYLRKVEGNADEIADIFYQQIEELVELTEKLYANCNSELVKNVCNYVVANIDDKVDLQSVAKNFYVNKSYLSHIFKQDIGKSFVDYVTIIKMERAKALLEDKSVMVYEIAETLGYADTEYFSKVFRKYVGISPTEYRKR